LKLGIIVGSQRKESFSRKIAKSIAALLPAGISPEWISLDLPMYNQDMDEAPPQSWLDFRARVRDCDAYLFVTPEYNRSFPPLMKNALDVASRPYGQNAWGGKKGAVVSVSPGALGGFGANHALRQAMVFLDIILLQQPEMYIGGVSKLLDDDGRPNESTNEFLRKFAVSFAAFLQG
jgi:chromate reductase